MLNSTDLSISYAKSLLLFVLLIFTIHAFAEGTKELQPTQPSNQSSTRLQIGSDQVDNFATYTSTPDKRMYIHIEDPATEKIYLGFGSHYHSGGDTTALYYRIKDPGGNIVSPGARVPVKGKGFINNYQQAVIGPQGLNGTFGGYDPIVFQPTVKGDYYIEFSTDNSEKKNGDKANRVIFDNFDITVASGLDIKPGRLWANTWSLYSCGFEVESYAKFFIYTTDSVVTRLDLNGMRPCGFGVLANQNGTTSSTIFTESRKSTKDNTSYPEYKIFLNDPDHIAYPNYTTDVKLTKPLQLNGCFDTGYCIQVSTSKDATGELLIDFNGNGIQDPRDRKLSLDLAAGDTCIYWDGKDAQGIVVPPGSIGKIFLKLYKGLTNFPIFDPEHNDKGIKVDVWRDTVSATGGRPIKIYWDDSNIPNLPATSQVKNLTGCLYTGEATGGCHVWNKPEESGGAGNNNTMNTWWYVFEYNDTTDFLLAPPPLVDAGKDIVLCDRTSLITLGKGTPEADVDYVWKEIAPLQTILTNDSSLIAQASINNTTKDSVKYYVTAMKGGCSVSDTVKVTFNTKSNPKIFGKELVCPNSKEVQYWVVDSNAIKFTWSVVSGKSITSGVSSDTITVDDWGTGIPLPIYDSVKVVTEYAGTCPKDSAYLKVTINEVIATPTPIGDSVFCSGQPASGTYIVPNSLNSVFTWFIDGMQDLSNTSNKLNVTWAGPPYNHTISVLETVTNTPIVCSDASAELNIRIVPPAVLLNTRDTATCSDVPLDLGPFVNLQPSNTTYNWTPPSHLSNSKIRNPIFRYASQNGDTLKYVLSAIVNGCKARDSINIKVKPDAKILDLSGIEACEDSTVTYTVRDTLGTSLEWFVYNADTISKTYDYTPVSSNQIKVKWGKSGTNAIVKVVTKGLCKPDTAIINVLVRKYEQYKPKGDSGLCYSGPVTLPYFVRGNGGGNFTWKLDTQPSGIGTFVGSTKNDSIQIRWSGIGSGQLYVVETGAEDSLCTTKPDTLYITITDKGNVDAGLDTTICLGETATLTAIGGSQYQWNPGGQSSQTIQVSPPKKTTYIVQLLDPCKATDSVVVDVRPIPVNPIKDALVRFCSDELDSVPLRAAPGYASYRWTPGSETDSVIFIEKSTLVFDEATYTVIVKDAFGCEGKDTIFLKSECPPTIFVPQIFSPNNDGANDLFQVFGLHFKDFELRIFNRWGEVIYMTNDRYKPWDGTYRGETMPVATYPWTITYRGKLEEDQSLKQLKGSVTLVK